MKTEPRVILEIHARGFNIETIRALFEDLRGAWAISSSEYNITKHPTNLSYINIVIVGSPSSSLEELEAILQKKINDLSRLKYDIKLIETDIKYEIN